MPELPLTLRLIGLRVTKLKDLRAESDQKTSGIKRFFGSNSSSSPKKKRRIEEEIEIADDDEPPSLSQDGFAEAMPGFHEHEEGDEAVIPNTEHLSDAGSAYEQDSNRSSTERNTASRRSRSTERSARDQHRPLKPASSSVRKPASSASSKPHSAMSRLARATDPNTSESISGPTSGQSLAGHDEAVYYQTCPICGKSMQTDNQGLNAHIDFCLSRQAIKEAQASAFITNSKPFTVKGSPDKSLRKGRHK